MNLKKINFVKIKTYIKPVYAWLLPLFIGFFLFQLALMILGGLAFDVILVVVNIVLIGLLVFLRRKQSTEISKVATLILTLAGMGLSLATQIDPVGDLKLMVGIKPKEKTQKLVEAPHEQPSDTETYFPKDWTNCIDATGTVEIGMPEGWWCGKMKFGKENPGGPEDVLIAVSPEEQPSVMLTDAIVMISKNNPFWMDSYEFHMKADGSRLGSAKLPNYDFEVVSSTNAVGPVDLYRVEHAGDVYIIIGNYPGSFDESKYDPLIYQIVQTVKLP